MPAKIDDLLKLVDPLDALIRGAAPMCKVLNLVGDDGEPTAADLRRFYYMAENKQIDVDQEGRIYVSTLRRLLKLPRAGTAA
jgi:hypothetical protein